MKTLLALFLAACAFAQDPPVQLTISVPKATYDALVTRLQTLGPRKADGTVVPTYTSVEGYVQAILAERISRLLPVQNPQTATLQQQLDDTATRLKQAQEQPITVTKQ